MGSPEKSRGMTPGTALFVILVIGSLIWYSISDRGNNRQGSTRQPYPAAVAHESEKQESASEKAEREEKHDHASKVLKTLQDSQIIGDVRIANRVGRAVVLPNFLLADFKDKQLAANVVYTWCTTFDPRCDLVVLHDSRNNKEVGRVSPTYGGLKMD